MDIMDVQMGKSVLFSKSCEVFNLDCDRHQDGKIYKSKNHFLFISRKMYNIC